MDNGLQKKFGLWTAISMVIGIVIGSGIFFKASKVLQLTDGDLGKSILVIALVGMIMIICSCVFAELGSRYEKVNGVVDYAEVALGSKYAYYVGWFMTTIYYPSLAAILAWLSAQYTCMLFGIDYHTSDGVWVAIGAMYLMIGYTVNAIAPRLAGKLQVSTTIIKLIPLALMGVVGTIAGLVNGNSLQMLQNPPVSSGAGSMLSAVCAFAFAYEGWIIATSINAELHDAKKNLPKALVIGALFCTAIYCLYVFSMSATLDGQGILAAGDWLPKVAFSNMFGETAGTLVFVFIIISCLGTMNGLIMGSCRGMYSVAVRGSGPKPEMFASVDRQVDMPLKSCIIAFAIAAFWFFDIHVIWWSGYVAPAIGLEYAIAGIPAWLAWEPDEIVIITLYACYIPMFIALMKKATDVGVFKRYILPSLGVAACAFMVYCGYYAYSSQVLGYLGFFAVVMLIGYLFDRRNSHQSSV